MDTLLKTEDDIETYELHELGSITDDSDLGDYMEDTPRSEDDNTILVYTAEEERAVVQKFDRRLVLFVALLYMLSFLDRSSSSYSLFPPFFSMVIYTSLNPNPSPLTHWILYTHSGNLWRLLPLPTA